MVKRKGEDITHPSPVVAVVSSPEFYATSPQSYLSPTNAEAPHSWERTQSIMDQFFQLLDGPNASEPILEIESYTNSLSKIQSHETTLRTQSQAIQKRIIDCIDDCDQACNLEIQELNKQEEYLDSLLVEFENLKLQNDNLNKEKQDLEDRIQQYKQEAAQHIEGIDEVEQKRKDEVPRLQQLISIHAITTGVTWDYESLDKFKGYIEIPKNNVHKRFSIEKHGLTNFQIAEQFWAIELY